MGFEKMNKILDEVINNVVSEGEKIAEEVKENRINPKEISEETVEQYLYTSGQPDPDLLIRTSGELRTSNFLPWQLVYSEFVVSPKMWPEFTEEDLSHIFDTFVITKEKFRPVGACIGLHLVYEIVRFVNGKISIQIVESEDPKFDKYHLHITIPKNSSKLKDKIFAFI